MTAISPILASKLAISKNTSNNSNNISNQNSNSTYQLPSTSAYVGSNTPQIVAQSKGSTSVVAGELKKLEGTLDEKIIKAKDIILKDLAIPSEAVVCEDADCGAGAYAATSLAEGKIYYNKEYCKNSDSVFSDEAILCILRHEIDHLVVSAKLYKALGASGFEKLMASEAMKKVLPPDKQKVNHELYQKLIPYVDIKDFDVQKYSSALEHYNEGVVVEGIEYSKCRHFTMITENFNNPLEHSARDKQYELEQRMGVTTLKDFYSMIEEAKILKAKIDGFLLTHADFEKDSECREIIFDYLYDSSAKELNLQDLPSNWSKILKVAQGKVGALVQVDVDKAYQLREAKKQK